MKPCNVCGIPKPDEDFSVNRAREDKRHLTCKVCARARSKRWYQQNREYKISQAEAYTSEHGKADWKPGIRRQIEEIRQQEEANSEYILIRLTPSEKAFCAQEGLKLGLRGEQFVQFLVKDARAASEVED